MVVVRIRNGNFFVAPTVLVNGFSVICFRTFFADPLPSFNWWAVLVDGEELKWRQLAHHHSSQQGPHFSPHNTAKSDDKSTNLRKNDGISHVAFASVYSEKTRLKKCLIIIIMITSNRKKHLLVNEKRRCRDG